MTTVQDYLRNDKWVKRTGEFFTQLDTNENGYLTREDYLLIIDKLAVAAPDRPVEIAELRKIMLEFTDALGLTKGVQADKQKYLELVAAFSLAEVARKKRGQMPLVEKRGSALFDVVDRNHDGRVTFEEFKIVMKSFGFDEDAGKATFARLDKNKDGAIQRKEYIDAGMTYWCTLDPVTQGMYGDKFE